MKRLIWLSSWLLVSCGVPISLDPGQPATPLSQPSASPSPSLSPSASPLASVTPRPALTPSPGPTASSPAQPSVQPSVSPTPQATATPKDISVAEATTLNGQVFDESGQAVEATLSLRSNSGPAFSARAQAIRGVYVFNAVPAGVTLELSAEAPGYSRVSRVIVLKSNRTGDPNANRIDFGGSGEHQAYFLTRGPRVISLTPLAETRFSAGKIPTFALRFDKAVDRSSVESALGVTAGETIALTGLTLAPGELVTAPRNLRWEWNSASTEASVRLPLLPARKTISTRYLLQFSAPIRSADGQSTPVQASDGTPLGPLWLNHTPANRQGLVIEKDDAALLFKTVDWSSQSLRLVFNKPLAFSFGNGTPQSFVTGLDQAANYGLRVDTAGNGSFSQQVPASSVSVLGDSLQIGFSIPAALTGKNARLELLNGFVPEDLSGHRLESALSQSFKL